MLINRWPGDSQRESGLVARIDSRKTKKQKNYFHNVRAIRANRLKPVIRNFLAARSAIRKKKGAQFGNAETRRENQAMRANLRIDSHESGHLSACATSPISRELSLTCATSPDFARLSTTTLHEIPRLCFGLFDRIARTPHCVSDLHTVLRDCTARWKSLRRSHGKATQGTGWEGTS